MNPKVKSKLEEMALPAGIDLSVLSLDSELPEDAVEMPEISVDTLYDDFKDRVAILTSDEVLDLMHRLLMDRAWIMSDWEENED